MTSKIIAIILNYNDAYTTKKLINVIKNYTTLDHIIVVDNCSRDNSYKQLQDLSSNKVEVIQTDSNRGYACGNNYGAFYAIKKYSPEYLLICNPDVFFTEDIPTNLSRALAKKSNYALASCKVSTGINTWNRPDFWGVIRSMLLICHNIEKKMVTKQFDPRRSLQKVDVVEGSMFCIKASVFKDIGGFDERTFLYYEENILSYKLAQKGYSEIFLLDCTYDHLHATSIQKEYQSKAKAFLNYHQSLKIYNKEYLQIKPWQNIIFNLFFCLAWLERVFYDFLNKIIHFK